MSDYLIDETTLTGIADAIRSKTGDNEPLMVSDMENQIKTISSLPPVTADDNGKIMQVVDGGLRAVAVEDSSVATYVNNYINDALGGDY